MRLGAHRYPHHSRNKPWIHHRQHTYLPHTVCRRWNLHSRYRYPLDRPDIHRPQDRASTWCAIGTIIPFGTDIAIGCPFRRDHPAFRAGFALSQSGLVIVRSYFTGITLGLGFICREETRRTWQTGIRSCAECACRARCAGGTERRLVSPFPRLPHVQKNDTLTY